MAPIKEEVQKKQQQDDSIHQAKTTTTTPATRILLLPNATTCLEVDPDGKYTKRYRPSLKDTKKCLKYYPPSNYIATMMKLLQGLPRAGSCLPTKGCDVTKLQPFDARMRNYGEDWPLFGYTMIGTARLENLRGAVTEVLLNNVEGSIVELGVWRGGAMILVAAILKDYVQRGIISKEESRSLYLYDAFENIIEGYGQSANFLSVSEQEVREAFDFFQLKTDNVHFIKGLFKDTVSKCNQTHGNEPIAVLRVDGNYYDSHQDVMYNLYERVPVGGIVIFDDIMTLPPVKQFWKDFKKAQQIPEQFVRIDKRSGWFRKTTATKIDRSKMKPPKDINKQ